MDAEDVYSFVFFVAGALCIASVGPWAAGITGALLIVIALAKPER